MSDLSFFQDRTILAPKNSILDEVNEYILNLVPGEEKIYLSYDSSLYAKPGTNSPDEVYTPEFLNTISAFNHGFVQQNTAGDYKDGKICS